MNMEWIDVERELPEPGEIVLVCSGKGYAIGQYFGRRKKNGYWVVTRKGYSGGEWSYANCSDISNIAVTHWMRLPPAPKRVRTEKVIMRHGYWEKREDNIGVLCSICGKDGLDELTYCPWCGSMMDDEEK